MGNYDIHSLTKQGDVTVDASSLSSSGIYDGIFTNFGNLKITLEINQASLGINPKSNSTDDVYAYILFSF